MEILVSMAILSSLSAIGISTFISYNRNQTLKTVMLDVSNMLETARARALTQVKPSEGVCADSSNTLKGYKVVLGNTITGSEIDEDKKARTYQMAAKCGDFYDDEEYMTKVLPNNVSFSFSEGVNGGSRRFLFPLFAEDVKAYYGDTEDTKINPEVITGKLQEITINGLGGCRKITVYKDGRIMKSECN